MGTIKCIIAAGGLGTRLQGFRDNQSTKILLKVNSKPMIIQQLEQLINWGLNDFVIITFNKSSVGRSIPINKKLSNLDFKSARSYLKSETGLILLIKIKFSSCFDWFSKE